MSGVEVSGSACLRRTGLSRRAAPGALSVRFGRLRPCLVMGEGLLSSLSPAPAESCWRSLAATCGSMGGAR